MSDKEKIEQPGKMVYTKKPRIVSSSWDDLHQSNRELRQRIQEKKDGDKEKSIEVFEHLINKQLRSERNRNYFVDKSNSYYKFNKMTNLQKEQAFSEDIFIKKQLKLQQNQP